MKPKIFRRIADRLLLILLSVSGMTLSAQEITDPISYIDGMIIGNGFDYYKGTIFPISPLVNRTTYTTPYDGQNAGTQIHFISDYQSLESALELNLNSSFDVGLVSGSVKSYFYNKVNFEKNTLYLLVKNVIYNHWDRLNAPELNTTAKGLLTTPNGVDNFGRSYGNTFVWGILAGGAYYGLITISTRSESEKLEINNELSGNVSGMVTVDIKQKFYKVSARKGVEIKTEEKIIGGTGLGYLLPTNNTALDKMIEKANKLAEQVQTSPVPFLAQVQPYTVFPEYSNVGKNLPIERQLALLNLNYDYLDYINLRKKLDYIIKNPEFFRFMPNDRNNKVNEFNTKIREIEANILKIKFTRELVADLTKPFPPVYPEAAKVFGSRIMLPESYMAMVRYLEETKTGKFDINPLTKRTSGDAEMHGHSPTIIVKANLNKIPLNLSTSVNIDAYCQIREDRSDWTTFEDRKTSVWITEGTDFAKGLVVNSVAPSQGQLNARGPENQRQWMIFQSNNTGLINSAECLTDTDGNETGKIGCKNITFNPVNIVYTHREDAENRPINYSRASEQPIQIFIPRMKSNLIMMKPVKENINIRKVKIMPIIKN